MTEEGDDLAYDSDLQLQELVGQCPQTDTDDRAQVGKRPREVPSPPPRAWPDPGGACASERMEEGALDDMLAMYDDFLTAVEGFERMRQGKEPHAEEAPDGDDAEQPTQEQRL